MLHSLFQQIRKTQWWPQDQKRSIFIPVPKTGNDKECSNYSTTALISHASNLMLKILQMRLQYYMTWEFPDVQAVCRKWRGTRDQIANICWIIEKAREFQKKHLLLLYWLHQSLWLCVSQQTMEKSSRDEDHLTCLLRSLFAGQEATVRTRHGITDWFKIGKGVCQGCILSSCLFNLYAEYIM